MHGVRAGLVLPSGVPVGKGADGNRDAHAARLSRLRLHGGKPDQPAHRTVDGAVGAAQVHLHDLLAGAGTGVGDEEVDAGRRGGDIRRRGVTRDRNGRGDVERIEVKRGVAEAKTELVGGSDAGLEPCAVSDVDAFLVAEHTILRRDVEHRDIRHRDWPRGGETSAGLVLSEQLVGERGAVLLATEVAEQDGLHVVAPRQRHGRTRVDHHNGRGVGRNHGTHQVVLAAGKVERFAIEALGLHLRVGSDNHNGNVGRASSLNRLGDQALRVGVVGLEPHGDTKYAGHALVAGVHVELDLELHGFTLAHLELNARGRRRQQVRSEVHSDRLRELLAQQLSVDEHPSTADGGVAEQNLAGGARGPGGSQLDDR